MRNGALHSPIQNLRKDLRNVARDAEELLRETADVTNDRVQEARSRALTAPGTWPARGSIGSTSPRYRGATRASISAPAAARSAAPAASSTGSDPGSTVTVPRRRSTSSSVTGWPAATHSFARKACAAGAARGCENRWRPPGRELRDVHVASARGRRRSREGRQRWVRGRR